MTKKIDAVILGCWENGYGVTRQLAAHKLRSVGVFTEEGEVWRHSRYFCEIARTPHPTREAEAFVEFLLRKSDRWQGALLIPTNDHYVGVLSRNKKILSEKYVVLAEEHSKIEKILDKTKLYEFARSFGIGTPTFFVPEAGNHWHEKAKDLSYPHMVKPAEGYKFFDHYRRKLFIVNSFDRLAERVRDAQEKGFKVAVQEIVPGPDGNLFSCMVYRNQAGKVLLEGARRKIRQNPPHFGVTRVGRTEWNPEVAELANRLIEAFDFKGLCSFEFKRDERTSQWKLLDGNPRFTLYHSIYNEAGINLAYLIYLDLVKKVPVEKKKVRNGIYWVNLHEDVRNTFFVKSDERTTLREFLTPYLRPHIFGDLDFRDPLPFVLRVWGLLWKGFKRCIKRMLRRGEPS